MEICLVHVNEIMIMSSQPVDMYRFIYIDEVGDEGARARSSLETDQSGVSVFKHVWRTIAASLIDFILLFRLRFLEINFEAEEL